VLPGDLAERGIRRDPGVREHNVEPSRRPLDLGEEADRESPMFGREALGGSNPSPSATNTKQLGFMLDTTESQVVSRGWRV
jgi:hypothetical protein